MELASPSAMCDDERVRVIARCRPLDENELKMKTEIIVSIDSTLHQCSLRKPSDPAKTRKIFTFDGVYGSKCTTEKLYSEIVHPIVDGVLDGYNGTVFAYGQTSCGKTFTMQGQGECAEPDNQVGIIPRCCKHILSSIQGKGHRESREYLLNVSYLEIYNEEIRDLLVKNTRCNLEIKEHPDKGMYVKGLSSITVDCYEDMAEIIEIGSGNRSVGATCMNTDSSRSHSIFIIDLQMNLRMEDEGECYRNGKLNLVDLAGSERQSKSGATGERFREATKINLSLSALGNVISALVDGKSKHIPYRDSKLTRLLQDSLGGNSKTLMVACISPGYNNYEETLSTLRYAKRAKSIKNRPRINEDPKDSLIRKYLEEIQELKKIIAKEVDIPPHLAVEIASLDRRRPSGESPERNSSSLTTTMTTLEVEEYQTELIETEIRHGQACTRQTAQTEKQFKFQRHFESRKTIVENCERELNLMNIRRGVLDGASMSLTSQAHATCEARDRGGRPEVELSSRTIGTSTDDLSSPSSASDTSDTGLRYRENVLFRTAGEGSSRSSSPYVGDPVRHARMTPQGKMGFQLDDEGPVSLGLWGICCPGISFFGERFFLHSKTL